MKTSFIFISMALHAAALAYPALFLESRAASPIMVTVIVALDGERGGTKSDGARPGKKPLPVARKAAPVKTQQQPMAAPEKIVEQPVAVSEPMVASAASSDISIFAGSAGETEGRRVSETSSASNVSGGSSGNGNGRGENGTGAGAGSGSGNAGPRFVTASYDYCPRPAYSENLEGTVILQVVVDEDGKPKSLAIHKSSGSRVLDQTAVKHVKQRCRFHPARRGERRVESVVEFPVVFKLAALDR